MIEGRDHEKDIVRLETVRTLAYAAADILGPEKMSDDPVGKMLLEVLSKAEARIIEYNRDILGIK